jgi:hypothetical protein
MLDTCLCVQEEGTNTGLLLEADRTLYLFCKTSQICAIYVRRRSWLGLLHRNICFCCNTFECGFVLRS